jgi:hypothetical protein
MMYDMEVRTITEVEIDPNLIQSGDFLALMRMDGSGPMIMYGAGSAVSHNTVALRFDGELYICESQGGSFWPISGI